MADNASSPLLIITGGIHPLTFDLVNDLGSCCTVVRSTSYRSDMPESSDQRHQDRQASSKSYLGATLTIELDAVRSIIDVPLKVAVLLGKVLDPVIPHCLNCVVCRTEK